MDQLFGELWQGVLSKKKCLCLNTIESCLQATILLCPCGGGRLHHLLFLPESNACLTLCHRGISEEERD